MIFFDITKTASVRHRSGLARLSARLREELGPAATEAPWTIARERAGERDWFVTTELFSEAERPGFGEFLRSKRCRTAAVFADAIPLKHPHITWPKSVARHPAYMKMLAGFERVWAISEASRMELLGYWRWLGLERQPSVAVLPLGADLGRISRVTTSDDELTGRPSLLCVGILEPRKNQMFLIDVCEELWTGGLQFDLHLVGRVNPIFGQPIVTRIEAVRKRFAGLQYHEAASDALLTRLYTDVRATVFPTIAEGCGLPLLESLWHGVPCVCSDLPVLRENSAGGGCVAVPVSNRHAWAEALRRVLTDNTFCASLRSEAVSRSLPTWAEAADVLRSGLD